MNFSGTDQGAVPRAKNFPKDVLVAAEQKLKEMRANPPRRATNSAAGWIREHFDDIEALVKSAGVSFEEIARQLRETGFVISVSTLQRAYRDAADEQQARRREARRRESEQADKKAPSPKPEPEASAPEAASAKPSRRTNAGGFVEMPKKL